MLVIFLFRVISDKINQKLPARASPLGSALATFIDITSRRLLLTRHQQCVHLSDLVLHLLVLLVLLGHHILQGGDLVRLRSNLIRLIHNLIVRLMLLSLQCAEICNKHWTTKLATATLLYDSSKLST
jgi:hypothetical protein